MNWPVVMLLTSIAAAGLVTPAFAQTCFEYGNCTTTDANFLDWATEPYEHVLGGFTLPLVWGMVTGLLYIKTQNSQLVTIIGIFMLTGLASSDAYLNSDSGQLFYWGIVIAAVAFGCTTFYLLKVKVVNPV